MQSRLFSVLVVLAVMMGVVSCGGGGGAAASSLFWAQNTAGDWMVYSNSPTGADAVKSSRGKGALPAVGTEVGVIRVYSDAEFCAMVRFSVRTGDTQPCAGGEVRLQGQRFPLVDCLWVGEWGVDWMTESALLNGIEDADWVHSEFRRYEGNALFSGGILDSSNPVSDFDWLCVNPSQVVSWRESWRPGDEVNIASVNRTCYSLDGTQDDQETGGSKIALDGVAFSYDPPPANWGAESIYFSRDDTYCIAPGDPDYWVRGYSRTYGPLLPLSFPDLTCP